LENQGLMEKSTDDSQVFPWPHLPNISMQDMVILQQDQVYRNAVKLGRISDVESMTKDEIWIAKQAWITKYGGTKFFPVIRMVV
jgi:hypothetical protein